MTATATLIFLAGAGDRFSPGGPGGWWFGPLIPVLWIALVALVVWLVVRRSKPADGDPLEHARRILSERYARGEVSTEEYRERLGQLS